MNASSWPPIESIVCAIDLRRSRRRALEEHVLDEMRDAALGVASRAAIRASARRRPSPTARAASPRSRAAGPTAASQQRPSSHTRGPPAVRRRRYSCKLFTGLTLEASLKIRNDTMSTGAVFHSLASHESRRARTRRDRGRSSTGARRARDSTAGRSSAGSTGAASPTSPR